VIGSADDYEHREWIAVRGLLWEGSNTIDPSGQTSRGSEIFIRSDVIVTIDDDSVLPLLSVYAAAGKTFPEATLDIFPSNGPSAQLVLDNVNITALSRSPAPAPRSRGCSLDRFQD